MDREKRGSQDAKASRQGGIFAQSKTRFDVWKISRFRKDGAARFGFLQRPADSRATQN
jgi:hypothetical protein